MSNVQRSYPTASHVFAQAPAAAATAFDLMILDPAVASILTPSGPVVSEPMNGYRPLRAVPATLRLPGRRRPLAVSLELLPWSQTRSELSIWCGSRPGLLVDRNVAAYLQAAHQSMRALAGLLDIEPVIAAAPRHALPAARNRKRVIAAQD